MSDAQGLILKAMISLHVACASRYSLKTAIIINSGVNCFISLLYVKIAKGFFNLI